MRRPRSRTANQRRRSGPISLRRRRRRRRCPLDGQAFQGQAVEGEKAKPDIAIPVFGYKNHGIDRRYGLIRTWLVSDAAAHDGAGCARDLWIAATSPRMSGPIPPTERRERTLSEGHRQGQSHPPQAQGHWLPRRTARANAAKSAVRSRRARLRRAEGADETRRPNHWDRPCPDQDRPCKPRLQHEAPARAQGDHCARSRKTNDIRQRSTENQ